MQLKGITTLSEVVEEKVLLSCEDKYLAIDLKGSRCNTLKQQSIPF